MKLPDVSLILATVGRTDELERLINSFAAQTFRNFELVVVDQNADERLVPYVEKAQIAGIAVKHLKHFPPNLAAARNAGIRAASGNWVAFPDDDCWYDDHLLERVVARFLKTDKPEGVVARWVEQGEQPEVASRLSWKRASAFRDVPVSSITLFCERALFEKIGGFDARLGVGQWFGAGEETDLVLRALRAGALFVYEPSAEVHHAAGPVTLPATREARRAERLRARGTGALYVKHKLPAWVVMRGLIAPILRPLLRGQFGKNLWIGWATVLGRVDGMIYWRRKQ